jgi:hypothetical protein
MPKHPMEEPDRVGEKGDAFPECGNATVARKQRGTGNSISADELDDGCRFNGCRDLPDKTTTYRLTNSV